MTLYTVRLNGRPIPIRHASATVIEHRPTGGMFDIPTQVEVEIDAPEVRLEDPGRIAELEGEVSRLKRAVRQLIGD